MRILLANTGHPSTIKGGAEAAVLDLAHGLVRRGHSVSLVVHHPGRDVENSVDGGVRVHALPNRNLYFGFEGGSHAAALRLAYHALDSANPMMAAAFGQVLDRERPDVVNTHSVVGLSQLVWREASRRGLPLVHYLHEYGSMCPRGSAFRDGHLCGTPCTPCAAITWPRRRLSALVDTVAGVSRFTLDRHLAWDFFPNARRVVLPNLFGDLSPRPRRPREAGTPLRFGYFGRLVPDKGPQVLIEAAARLAPGAWTLDIAGAGEPDFIAGLKAAAPEGVRFLGWTKPADFFAAIDVLVLPSVWPDPQPRVTFEAFQHGVAVIGSRAGGIPEEIDEGRTGWLAEAGSADDLSRVMAARIADRADLTLDPEAFRRRLARLDPARVVEDYEAVYAEAIGRKRGGAPGSQRRTAIG